MVAETLLIFCMFLLATVLAHFFSHYRLEKLERQVELIRALNTLPHIQHYNTLVPDSRSVMTEAELAAFRTDPLQGLERYEQQMSYEPETLMGPDGEELTEIVSLKDFD